jgi:hypothetical protein
MSGGDKFIIDGETGKILAITDSSTIASAPRLTPKEAVTECEAIRTYMREKWAYDDSIPLSQAVSALLDHMLEEHFPLRSLELADFSLSDATK